jgi:phage gp46-like protein
MTDFALVWNTGTAEADFAIDAGAFDLLTDDGLQTAVIISLMTDRLAADDETPPDGSSDRRGWWGDLPIDGSLPTDIDLIGSKLWLRTREKADAASALLIQNDCQDALAWMIADGIAQDVSVTATWLTAEQLGLVVAISRYTQRGAVENKTFDLIWNAALAA